jgi:hypothetical protein
MYINIPITENRKKIRNGTLDAIRLRSFFLSDTDTTGLLMTVQKESERVEISFGMIGYFFDRIYVL